MEHLKRIVDLIFSDDQEAVELAQDLLLENRLVTHPAIRELSIRIPDIKKCMLYYERGHAQNIVGSRYSLKVIRHITDIYKRFNNIPYSLARHIFDKLEYILKDFFAIQHHFRLKSHILNLKIYHRRLCAKYRYDADI